MNSRIGLWMFCREIPRRRITFGFLSVAKRFWLAVGCILCRMLCHQSGPTIGSALEVFRFPCDTSHANAKKLSSYTHPVGHISFAQESVLAQRFETTARMEPVAAFRSDRRLFCLSAISPRTGPDWQQHLRFWIDKNPSSFFAPKRSHSLALSRTFRNDGFSKVGRTKFPHLVFLTGVYEKLYTDISMRFITEIVAKSQQYRWDFPKSWYESFNGDIQINSIKTCC